MALKPIKEVDRWIKVKKVFNKRANRYLDAAEYGREYWIIPIRNRKQ